MPDGKEILSALTEKRQGYKAFVDAVDADLRVERAKRIATRQGEIHSLILQAYLAGESINAIKRAYGTTDFRTIKNVIENSKNEIAALLAAREHENEAVYPDWFEVVRDDGVYIDESLYDITPLERDEYLLSLDPDSEEPDDGRWDGYVLFPTDPDDDARALYNAIHGEVTGS